MPLIRMGKRSGKYSLSRDLYVLSIQLMEEARVLQCTLSTESTGKDCLEYICLKLELRQGCYFGLRFKCARLKYRWVELDKPLRKQLEKFAQEQRLYFAVMYHTPNANLLTDEISRYYYFLQMKSDVIEGRLLIPPEKAILLASYCLQVELGEYNEIAHTVEFLKSFPLLPKHMSRSAQILEDLIRQVLLGHRSLAGLEPAEAELLYITELLPCDGYGEDYFQARDEDGSETLVGYSQDGIVVKRLQGAPLKYRWEEIFKIASQKRNLLIRCAELSSIHFTMEDAEMARYVAGIFSLQLEFFRMFLWKAKSLQRLPSGAGDLQWKYKPGPFRSEMVPTNQVHSEQIIHPSITPISEIDESDDRSVDSGNQGTSAGLFSGAHSQTSINNTNEFQNAHSSNERTDNIIPDLISKPSLDTIFGSISQFSETNTEQTAPPYKPAPDYATALHQPSLDPQILEHLYVGSTPDINTISIPNNNIPLPQQIHNLYCHSTPDLTLSVLESIGSRPSTAYEQRAERSATVAQINTERIYSDSTTQTSENGETIHEHTTSVLVDSGGSQQQLEDEKDHSSKRDRSVSLPPPSINKSISDQPIRANTTFNGVVLSTRPDILQGSQDKDVSNDERLSLMESRLNEGRLTEEFDSIPRKRVSAGVSTSQKVENVRRNKYNNLLPYEDTRVMLRPNRHNQLGYINASNIQIPLGDVLLKYIASQSPLKETCADFWQMVWESGAQLIVMLNKCENKKEQSFQYWPLGGNSKSKLKFGEFQVSLSSRTETQSQVTSSLTLKHIPSAQRRDLYHIQYTQWPSGGIPDNLDSFLAFLDEVSSVSRHLENESMRTVSNHHTPTSNKVNCRPRSKSASQLPDLNVRLEPKLSTTRLDVLPCADWLRETETPPTIVHCCSGAGRTGAYILVHLLIYCLEHNHNTDVSVGLKMLRQQRMHLIQTAAQYKFVYRCLVEHLSNSRLI